MYALTVVCSVTHVLTPDRAVLADEQPPPRDADSTWNDDGTGSLWAPSDLVPRKRRVDVLVAGHAYSAGGEAVTSLAVRLVVGSLSKAVVVRGDRVWTSDDRLSPPAPFTSMPLRWELAAGGPGTSNPVGIPPSPPPDENGFRPVPNILPPRAVVLSPDQDIPPAGLGPLAPSWPDRVSRLGHRRPVFSPEGHIVGPLADDLDFAFFNAAAPDQQLESVGAKLPLVLENLHPEYAVLLTEIPSAPPTAFVRRTDGAHEELRLACDTIWIDSYRGTCTLTYRGVVALRHADEEGLVVVTEPGSPLPRDLVTPWRHDAPPVTTSPRDDEDETTLVGRAAAAAAAAAKSNADDEDWNETTQTGPTVPGDGAVFAAPSAVIRSGAASPAPMLPPPIVVPSLPNIPVPSPAVASVPPPSMPVPSPAVASAPPPSMPVPSPAVASVPPPSMPVPSPAVASVPPPSMPVPPSAAAGPPPAGAPFRRPMTMVLGPGALDDMKRGALPFQATPPPVSTRTPKPGPSFAAEDNTRTIDIAALSRAAAPVPFKPEPPSHRAWTTLPGQTPTSALPFKEDIKEDTLVGRAPAPVAPTPVLPFEPVAPGASPPAFGPPPAPPAGSAPTRGKTWLPVLSNAPVLPFQTSPSTPPPGPSPSSAPPSLPPFGLAPSAEPSATSPGDWHAPRPAPASESPPAPPGDWHAHAPTPALESPSMGLFATPTTQASIPLSATPPAPGGEPFVPSARAVTPPVALPEAPALSVLEYTEIKSEIWTGGKLADVLARRGIDEVEWRAEERRQTDRLAAEAAEGKHDLALALADALRQARAKARAAKLPLSAPAPRA